MNNENKRFLIKSMYICPFDFSKENFVVQREGYPMRFCVLDTDKKIAVDILHGLKYDYLETLSGLYILSDYITQIKNGERYAAFPEQSNGPDNITFSKALDIIKKLKAGGKFENGNEVLSNDEYLNLITKTGNEQLKIIKKKVRKSN